MLDEIGEMSPGIQAKFLRVLEGHPFERVGGSKPINGRRAGDRRHQPRPGKGRGRRASSAATCISACACWRSSCPPCGNAPEDIPLLADYFLRQVTTPRPAARSAALRPEASEQLLNVPLAGQRPRVEERHRAGGGALPRPGNRPGRPAVDEAGHGRRHGRASPQAAEEFLPASLADIERRYILATLEPHRLEQEPHRQHPGHRAIHAGPQDPPLRVGRGGGPHPLGGSYGTNGTHGTYRTHESYRPHFPLAAIAVLRSRPSKVRCSLAGTS